MANRVLGIEYAGDRIKIVEVSFARKLKIHNFAVIDNRNTDPERRTEQLNHTLQVRGFEARDAVIATAGGNVEHRLLTLPPLSLREMHFVMQRESKKLAPTSMAEMVWSYDVLKTKEELGIKKNQILLVTAERPMVDAAQNLLNQTKLKLLQVTTIPEAVMNLLRQVTAWKKETVRTFVHFAGEGVHILFAQDGVLLLSREIRFDAADMGHDEQVERLGNELKRSTLYFRQNFPQAQLDQVVFSGDHDILGTLATQAANELGIPGSILQFEENLDTSAFRGNWDEFRFHLPSLAAAIGAAWRKTPGLSGVNLLPGKTQAKQEAGINPTKIARVGCAVAVVVALITGGYYLREKGRIDAARQDLLSRQSVVDPKLQQMADIERRKAASEGRAAFLQRIGPRVDWTELLRSLAYIIPDSAVLDVVHVEASTPPKMTIRGAIWAMSAQDGNADFTQFFSALGGLPFFRTVNLAKPIVVSSEEGSTSRTGGAAPVPSSPRSKVAFEIVGELP